MRKVYPLITLLKIKNKGKMESNIQFIQTTPDYLLANISKIVKQTLENIKLDKENPEQLLTRKQTAELLNVTLATLNDWSKDGKLKSYGIGNRVYYKKNEVLEALTPLNK